MSKPDSIIKEARDLLKQHEAGLDFERQLLWSMDLQRVAVRLLENTDMSEWGRQPKNLKIVAEVAKALSKIHLADHLARLIAAGAALNTKPDSDLEKEMVGLFDRLTAPSEPFDADRQTAIAQDCVTALSNVYAYHNKTTKDAARAKIPHAGEHGFNLRPVAMSRLFKGTLLGDPESTIEAYAVVAECSPPDSPERLAAVLGLLRYPQYAGFFDGSDAEGYIESFAPIGSVIRDEAEEMLKIDATFPLKDLLDRTREMKKELRP